MVRFKSVVVGALILGMGGVSSAQLFAECNIGEQYKMNTVYTVKNSIKASSLESEYRDKFYSVLKDYLDIDTSKFPTDATFSVAIIDRKTIKEQDAKMLDAERKLYENKQITEDRYRQTLEQVERHKNDTHDEVHCTLALPGDEVEFGDGYRVTFNADTKEVLFAKVTMSMEGNEILADDKAAKISVKDFQEQYANFIKKYRIGGIQNPKCITEQFKGTNEAGNMSVLIYQDQNDENKMVTIGLDGATGKITYIYTW